MAGDRTGWPQIVTGGGSWRVVTGGKEVGRDTECAGAPGPNSLRVKTSLGERLRFRAYPPRFLKPEQNFSEFERQAFQRQFTNQISNTCKPRLAGKRPTSHMPHSKKISR